MNYRMLFHLLNLCTLLDVSFLFPFHLIHPCVHATRFLSGVALAVEEMCLGDMYTVMQVEEKFAHKNFEMRTNDKRSRETNNTLQK